VGVCRHGGERAGMAPDLGRASWDGLCAPESHGDSLDGAPSPREPRGRISRVPTDNECVHSLVPQDEMTQAAALSTAMICSAVCRWRVMDPSWRAHLSTGALSIQWSSFSSGRSGERRQVRTCELRDADSEGSTRVLASSHFGPIDYTPRSAVFRQFPALGYRRQFVDPLRMSPCRDTPLDH
jgi:hypothetical protein